MDRILAVPLCALQGQSIDGRAAFSQHSGAVSCFARAGTSLRVPVPKASVWYLVSLSGYIH